jgi:hypothetical protein
MSMRCIAIRESITMMAGIPVDENIGLSTEHHIGGLSAVDSRTQMIDMVIWIHQFKGIFLLHNKTLARMWA